MEKRPSMPHVTFESPIENPWKNPELVTLYRYENPDMAAHKGDGSVGTEEQIGLWYTDNLKDLGTYILMRPPGGRLVAVRVPRSSLESLDASKRQDTKDMDIERGNYIVEPSAAFARIEIPVPVATDKKKFHLTDMPTVRSFLAEELNEEKLGQRAEDIK